MLTKNFYSYMRVTLVNRSDTANFVTVHGEIIGATASNSDFILPFAAMTTAGLFLQREDNTTTKMTGVRFGSDDTPPTVDDYKLKNQITSGLSFTNPANITYTLSNTYSEYTATYGVTNTSEEAITIKEIGLFAQCSSASTTTVKKFRPCLVDRTILDEPITIPAGESKQITYTIRFNYGA